MFHQRRNFLAYPNFGHSSMSSSFIFVHFYICLLIIILVVTSFLFFFPFSITHGLSIVYLVLILRYKISNKLLFSYPSVNLFPRLFLLFHSSCLITNVLLTVSSSTGATEGHRSSNQEATSAT